MLISVTFKIKIKIQHTTPDTDTKTSEFRTNNPPQNMDSIKKTIEITTSNRHYPRDPCNATQMQHNDLDGGNWKY